ncbi:hypothetical protein [Moellerella wisconsensis]|uniref:Chemotaxis protein n=1 Tax=Moellerella wisconsensis TaxID=158849 RepID=A0A9Q8Q3B9_9GAMM|nr:hypothetical protein [Moellerella wisconsensis]UNH31391.1 hypothetical protein MNY72_03465 [Moellerella wisconsensis]
MAIPFIIAGVAAIAGAFGAKKGYDAVCDTKDAKKNKENAISIYDDAKTKLEKSREEGLIALNDLGSLKIKALKYIKESEELLDNIDPAIADKIRKRTANTNISNGLKTGNIPNLQKEAELIITTVTGLGSGSLAGLAAGGGAYLGAGALATASTGTAISSLGGAAATNATLAWFGGGSLATGGLGMAGGTAILGGIVAGPVLAVGGMVMASKAAKAKTESEQSLSKAKILASDFELATAKVKTINVHVRQTQSWLDTLLTLWISPSGLFVQFKQLTEVKHDNFNKEEELVLFQCHLFADALYKIIDIEMFNTEGELTDESKKLISHSPEKKYGEIMSVRCELTC